MPIDRPAGISGLGSTPIPPSPVRPATPARALVPVAPVRPRGPGMAQPPLGRSGIDLGDLLLAEDTLAERTPSTPVAVDMGLERARGALVRQAPGDALAALDDIWQDAQWGEQGWYLRAGALTAMGLPGEGDRVAGEGLERQPDSRALRFVQSVARLLVGDLSGARAALMPALDATPDEPVLMAQQAVVLARQGHGDDARAMLGSLQSRAPQHPALEWARRMVQSIQADGTRQRAQSTLADWPVDAAQPPIDDWPIDEIGDDGRADALTGDDGDIQDAAFVRLGQMLVTTSPAAAATRMRSLIVAYSAGGHMAATVPPEPAHAARSMLGALLSVVSETVGPPSTDVPSGASAVARPVLANLWSMMQASATGVPTAARSSRRPQSAEDVARAARRMATALPPAMRPLLDALIRGALAGIVSRTDTPVTNPAIDAAARRTPRASEPILRHSGEFAAVLHEERDLRAPLVPIRLGLSLLRDDDGERAAAGAAAGAADEPAWASDRVVTSPLRETLSSAGRFTPSHLHDAALLHPERETSSVRGAATPVRGAELRGEGWGAAAQVRPTPQDQGGRRVGLAAIVLVGGAIVAATQGAAVIAIALGLGAAWVGVRRG